MRRNALKRKLLAGDVAVGLFTATGNPHVVGITAGTGYDYVMGDLEHTALTLRELEALVLAADAAGITPSTRVAGCTKPDILAAMEAGVQTIMVPAVETVEEAESIVRAARYSPEGCRGVYFLGYGSGYGRVTPQEYFGGCNEEILILAQIETAKGVENADAIAAVPGIDCLFVGPGDLSGSLGVVWEFDHPTVWDAVRKTFRAAKQHGKIAGIMPVGIDHAARCREEGASLLLWGTDLGMFQRAAREDAAALAEVTGWRPSAVKA